jgi:hypothetical protein
MLGSDVRMRGKDEVRGSLFSYVVLLRTIRGIVNAALAEMSAEFDALYPQTGRDSIPPERLLRVLLLQAFYSIWSERQLVERIDFDLLFRWFVGFGVDDRVWDAISFDPEPRPPAGGRGRQPLPGHDPRPAQDADAALDGAFLGRWHAAGSPGQPKSFRPKDGSGAPPAVGRNGEQDFRGRKRRNATHASTTTPTRGFTATALARRRSSASWGTRSWRTGAG